MMRNLLGFEPQGRYMTPRVVPLLLVLAGLPAIPAFSQDTNSSSERSLPNHPVGDLGIAGYLTPNIVRGDGDSLLPLPYAYLDYWRFFARLDTVGVKTVPVGRGYLEVAARINFYGYDAEGPELRGLEPRGHSILIGVGTFQRIPVGGVFLNAFHVVNDWGGNLLEGLYGTRVMLGRVAFYPQVGVEYRDRQYVRYYYGIDDREAAASGYPPYDPDGALNPMVALQLDVPIAGNVFLNVYGRHRWLDDAITRSPIVKAGGENAGFVALSYRFQ
jgi:outer membrane protein